jgi:DNA polymerase III epsilon subunit family exonuclease
MTDIDKSATQNPDLSDNAVRKIIDFGRFVAIDIETTGLNPGDGEIIELGAVRFENSRELEIFRTLVKPEHGLPERNRRLTGIEPAMLDTAPEPKSALMDFMEFIGNDLLVSHNAQFDTSFLQHHLKQAGFTELTNTAICTLHLAAFINPEVASLQLGNLAELLKIEVIDAHRALQDARTAGRLFLKIKAEIESWSKDFTAHLAGYRGKSIDPIFDLLDAVAGDHAPDSGNFNLGQEIVERLRNPESKSPLPLLIFHEPASPPSVSQDKFLRDEILDACKHGGVTLIEDSRPGTGLASMVIPINSVNSLWRFRTKVLFPISLVMIMALMATRKMAGYFSSGQEATMCAHSRLSKRMGVRLDGSN